MPFSFVDFLAFVFIPFGFYFIFGWLIFYHLRRYGLKGDSTKNTAYFFAVILVLICIAIVITFFLIDWNSINPNDFIEKSNINLQK
ncbi:MAG: hypothetical protein P1P85_03720 [Patescibacteria group bacterium]|nr:hypothetical protein [Patescibacteria group bacterium]